MRDAKETDGETGDRNTWSRRPGGTLRSGLVATCCVMRGKRQQTGVGGSGTEPGFGFLATPHTLEY